MFNMAHEQEQKAFLDEEYRFQNPVDELIEYLSPSQPTINQLEANTSSQDPIQEKDELDALANRLVREGKAIRVGNAVVSLPPTTPQEIAKQKRRYQELAQKYRRDFEAAQRERFTRYTDIEKESENSGS